MTKVLYFYEKEFYIDKVSTMWTLSGEEVAKDQDFEQHSKRSPLNLTENKDSDVSLFKIFKWKITCWFNIDFKLKL